MIDRSEPNKYSPEVKPAPSICPRKYCFLFSGPESLFISGEDQSLPPTETVTQTTEDGQCRSPFGFCIRYRPDLSNKDWYEPHDIHLEEAGLPWFYFIPTPFKLEQSERKKYIKESEALWGKKHWETDNSHNTQHRFKDIK